MAQSFLGQKRLRKYYGKIREVLDMPNLIEVQKSSYDLFLASGEAETPTDGEGITVSSSRSSRSRISTKLRFWNTSNTNSSTPSTMSKSASSAT